MPTRQEVRATITLNHNAYHDKWNSIETPSERFAGTQDLRDIRDNYIESLDPGLRQAFSDAKEFMKNEHAYVYWNSGWSNCTDYDNILGLYHGVSKWDHINGDGFRWFQIRLDKMRDVQAAGGLDTSHIDGHEQKILAFLDDVASRNEDLTQG